MYHGACLQVGPHDDIILMRPTGLGPGQYQPLPQPLPGSLGAWKPEQYERRWGCMPLPAIPT
jgi:hypothetical protein